jgi:hypothetical protein
MSPFKDPDGSYSVRKFGGYLALILLAFLIITFAWANSFKEKVPTEYLLSIDTIIAFYFIKSTLSNLRLNSKVDDATTNKVATEDTLKESTNK